MIELLIAALIVAGALATAAATLRTAHVAGPRRVTTRPRYNSRAPHL